MPLLQAAVKRFDISNPVDGHPFPSWLPREALPSKPDPEMLQWHDRVSDNLMIEVQKSQAHRNPNMHTRALSDVTSEGTLESSRDSHSRGSSTTDDQSLVNVGTHFAERRPRPFFKPPEPLYMPPGNRPPPQQQWGASKGPLPWNPERQRSSSDPQHHRTSSSSWSHKDGVSRRNTVVRSDTHPRSRARSPSTVSTSSASSTTSDSSSSSDDSDDQEHARRRTSSTATLQPASSRSSHTLNSPPNTHASRQPSPITHASTSPLRPTSQYDTSSTLLPQHRQPVPARANARGLNVRWGADSVHDLPRRDREKAVEGKSRARSEERPRRRGDDDRNDFDNERGPVKGVGGRRYPNDERAGWR